MDKLKILVIDDDEIAQSLITKVLTIGGYRSVIADSANIALQQLRSGQWACVILELSVLGGGGLELLQMIKKAHPKLPVIVLTDEKKLESAIAAMRYQAANYLIKPVMPRDILNSIGEALKTLKPKNINHQQDKLIAPKVQSITQGVRFYEIDRRIQTDDRSINLTGLESKIFALLVSRDPAVVPTSEIVALSQGYEVTNSEAAQIIRPTISRLNQKLASITTEKIRIANMRGVGYFLEKCVVKHPS